MSERRRAHVGRPTSSVHAPVPRVQQPDPGRLREVRQHARDSGQPSRNVLEVQPGRHDARHDDGPVRPLGERLRDAGQQLRDSWDKLNKTLQGVERRFVETLGLDARGRVKLRENEDDPQYIEHLVFRGGRLWVEHGRPGRPLACVPLVHATKEQRLAACDRFQKLWTECGGLPPPGV